MAELTKISWCDHSFNPWTGCTKVGPGCDHCYAESWAKRSGIVQWGVDAERRRTSSHVWAKAMKWNAQHEKFFAEHGRRQRVFSASLADVFDNAAPPSWRRDLFDVIEFTPNLDWLLLTKRVGNVRQMAPNAWLEADWPLNAWLGATIVTREEMLRDGPKLKALPAPIKFWSAEPLLEDLGEVPPEIAPDWIIIGGESGANCRPCPDRWIRSLKEEAEHHAVPVFVKQMGGFPDKREELEQFPVDLRVREWPESRA